MLKEGHLVHRYTDGTESPVPVQLKSLGDGSVITRNFPGIISLTEEPTWDSSSDTSYSPEPGKISTDSTRSGSPIPDEQDSNMKLLNGRGQTYILTTDQEHKSSTKRRQSGHRKEFHNVPFAQLTRTDKS